MKQEEKTDTGEILQVEVLEKNALESITNAEIDKQIATAKTYPRNIRKSIDNIRALATLNQNVAEKCFYVLPRGGKKIEGASVRLAEIVGNNWGNLRIAARIVKNDGKKITAQGICHDLESNVAYSVEVDRKITDKYGKVYNEDMQIMTGNAACAIALRNAVFKCVPVSLLDELMPEIKEVAIGKGLDMETKRNNAITSYSKLGVQEADLLKLLDLTSIAEITNDDLFTLRGLHTAIKEGTTTVEQTFGKLDEIDQKERESIKKLADKAIKDKSSKD